VCSKGYRGEDGHFIVIRFTIAWTGCRAFRVSRGMNLWNSLTWPRENDERPSYCKICALLSLPATGITRTLIITRHDIISCWRSVKYKNVKCKASHNFNFPVSLPLGRDVEEIKHKRQSFFFYAAMCILLLYNIYYICVVHRRIIAQAREETSWFVNARKNYLHYSNEILRESLCALSLRTIA